MTDSVRIFEVGPRDDLQNEKTAVSGADRIAFKADGIRVRGYVSWVLGCPYEGDVECDRASSE